MSNDSVVTASTTSRSDMPGLARDAGQEVDDRAVRDAHALGLAGRARGVDDVGGVVGRACGRRRRRRGVPGVTAAPRPPRARRRAGPAGSRRSPPRRRPRSRASVTIAVSRRVLDHEPQAVGRERRDRAARRRRRPRARRASRAAGRGRARPAGRRGRPAARRARAARRRSRRSARRARRSARSRRGSAPRRDRARAARWRRSAPRPAPPCGYSASVWFHAASARRSASDTTGSRPSARVGSATAPRSRSSNAASQRRTVAASNRSLLYWHSRRIPAGPASTALMNSSKVSWWRGFDASSIPTPGRLWASPVSAWSMLKIALISGSRPGSRATGRTWSTRPNVTSWCS